MNIVLAAVLVAYMAVDLWLSHRAESRIDDLEATCLVFGSDIEYLYDVIDYEILLEDLAEPEEEE